mmetsp:Transcript_84948/g.142015  ORF Transcript_84948/g.142015 Transcript_84948/m.142015 type:complete len:208 (+) Transcript_84948:209-832(+)
MFRNTSSKLVWLMPQSTIPCCLCSAASLSNSSPMLPWVSSSKVMLPRVLRPSSRASGASDWTYSMTDARSPSANETLKRKPLPCLFLRCSGDPKQRKCPRAMIPILSDSTSASSMEWVVRMMQRSLLASCTKSQISRRCPGSSPVVGSSNITTRGLPTKEMAMLSLRCSPPLILAGLLLRYRSSPTLLSQYSTCSFSACGGTPFRRA